MLSSVPFAPYEQYMPAYTGVIGALGVVSPGPMLDGGEGDLGLVSFTVKSGEALSTEDIVYYFEHVLPHFLTPFPGPRSIVVLDNAPGHRALENYAQQRITIAVQRVGAHIIWLPPHSPDMNPIEHVWHVTKALEKSMIIELATGRHGYMPRPFTPIDLPVCLQRARLSGLAFANIFTQPL